jgi:DNA-binding PadR family transcriptional regulator
VVAFPQDAGEVVGQSTEELAEALVIDRGALAHNLKPLERDGLVEVRAESKDRRNHLVALTSVGRAKLVESGVFWARTSFDREPTFFNGSGQNRTSPQGRLPRANSRRLKCGSSQIAERDGPCARVSRTAASAAVALSGCTFS